MHNYLPFCVYWVVTVGNRWRYHWLHGVTPVKYYANLSDRFTGLRAIVSPLQIGGGVGCASQWRVSFVAKWKQHLCLLKGTEKLSVCLRFTSRSKGSLLLISVDAVAC